MAYNVAVVTEVDDRAALDALMHEFYTVMLKKFASAGGPPLYSPRDFVELFWRNIHKFLPPSGRLVLVKDATSRLVGCGTLQQARADAGELKRLYVRPEAQGLGLGKAIIYERMKAAREMGWKTLLVNAIRGNQDMIRIYEKLGFRYIDRYPECSDPSEVEEFFVYMQYDFS